MNNLKKYLKTINWNRFWDKCIHFAHLQLFLTLISLPVLIAWGLPISILSPLGNLIFSIPLALFLLLSSLIFFCEILYIPNASFIWLTEKLTTFWTWSMSGQHKYLMIGFSCPSLFLLSLIPITAIIIMQCRYTHPKKQAVVGLLLLLLCTCLGLKIKDYYRPSLITIAKNQGTITLLKTNTELILIDPGYIGSTLSASTWVTHTLIPEIIKQTGTLTIDHLIVLQLNSITLEALALLCTKIMVKKLYIPWWAGTLKGKEWYNYKNLSTALHNNGGKRIVLKNSSITIPTAKHQSLLIKPTEQLITYNNITYPAYCVDGTIDNHSFTIYAAKHTKMKRIS